jgi:hypothetical protein
MSVPPLISPFVYAILSARSLHSSQRIEDTWSSLSSKAEDKHIVRVNIQANVRKLFTYFNWFCNVRVNSGFEILGIFLRLFTTWRWSRRQSQLTYTCAVRPQESELCAILALGFWNLIYIYIYSSVVRIATGYGLDGLGIESRCGEIFRTCSDRPWGPPSLLYNGYRVFPGGKAAGALCWPPTPSQRRGQEWVELYFYSPSGLSGPIVGQTLLIWNFP